MRQLTGWSKDLRVTADGEDVVAMVGVASLRMLADRTGLTRAGHRPAGRAANPGPQPAGQSRPA